MIDVDAPRDLRGVGRLAVGAVAGYLLAHTLALAYIVGDLVLGGLNLTPGLMAFAVRYGYDPRIWLAWGSTSEVLVLAASYLLAFAAVALVLSATGDADVDELEPATAGEVGP